MKVGDLILFTPDEAEEHGGEPGVGIVLNLHRSGVKALVLWSTESKGFYFPIGDLERYPDAYKLVSQ